jgi:hypothetical protein
MDSPTAPPPNRFTLKPFAVALDWLTLNMDAPNQNPFAVDVVSPWSGWQYPAACWIVPRTKGTNVFRRVVDVLDANRCKLFTVAMEPAAAALHRSHWCQVQFSNPTLYGTVWVNLFWSLRAQGFTLDSVSRVDIAADGLAGDGGQYLDVMHGRMGGRLRYYGKGNWAPYMQRDGVQGFSMGARSSDKFIRCYNKTREMKQVGRKPHIFNHWAAALGGEDPETLPDVIRFEASMKGKGIRRYVGNAERSDQWVADLATGAQMVKLFASVVPSVFDFRTPPADPKGRARDARPAVAWDWSRIQAGAVDVDTRATRAHLLTDDEIKRGCRWLFLLSLFMADGTIMETAQRAAAAGGPHLAEWFHRKRAEWFKHYTKLFSTADARTMEFARAVGGGADNLPATLSDAFALG